tara:strand:- start:314 stop:757 length:444 start_codon:yes stop_codon:yes gene_type:complete
MEKYSGRCHCGMVTYKINGEPTWKVNCNCNWCQKTSGSAFRSFLIFKEEDITFDGESLTSYEDTKTEHGRTMISQFCSNCGTQIGINAAGATGKQHISIGSLDQRKNINITDNIWAQEALQFVTFPKDDDVYKNRYDNGTGEKIKRE